MSVGRALGGALSAGTMQVAKSLREEDCLRQAQTAAKYYEQADCAMQPVANGADKLSQVASYVYRLNDAIGALEGKLTTAGLLVPSIPVANPEKKQVLSVQSDLASTLEGLARELEMQEMRIHILRDRVDF
jgi:hypothetical protein